MKIPIWKWLGVINIGLLCWLIGLKLHNKSSPSKLNHKDEETPSVSILSLEPKTPADDDFQSKLQAEDKVEYVLENYADWDLEVALLRIAEDYGKLGPEAIKHFLLSLPPGEIGVNPMMSAMEFLSIDEVPDMFAWLSAHWEELGTSFAQTTLLTTVDQRISDDPEIVMQSLIDMESVPDSEKLMLLKRCLDSDEESVEALQSIADRTEDESLRKQIAFLPPVLKGHLEESPSDTLNLLTEIDDPLERGRAITGLENTIALISNPSEVLEVFRDLEIPDIDTSYVRVVAQWVRTDPNEALQWVGQMENGESRDGVISAAWSWIAEYDIVAAREWIETVQRDRLREVLLERLEAHTGE